MVTENGNILQSFREHNTSVKVSFLLHKLDKNLMLNLSLQNQI